MVVDEDYVANASDDEDGDIQPRRRGGGGTRAARLEKESAFEVTRTWEALEEAADGTISGAVDEMMEAGKKKRYVFEGV